MSPVATVVTSDLITFILSMGVSALGFAVQWGKINERVAEMQRTMVTKDELTGIKETLAEIKGMFTLKLKDGLCIG